MRVREATKNGSISSDRRVWKNSMDFMRRLIAMSFSVPVSFLSPSKTEWRGQVRELLRLLNEEEESENNSNDLSL